MSIESVVYVDVFREAIVALGRSLAAVDIHLLPRSTFIRVVGIEMRIAVSSLVVAVSGPP